MIKPMDNSRYSEQPILWIKQYSPKLMSFAIQRPINYSFKAGQFARLGFILNGEYIWRSYSVVSPESETDLLEFYAILIEDGLMSNFFLNMQVGDKILLWDDANGFLVPELFNPENSIDKDLVLLSTGSGIAPFMPMLFKESVWQTFRHVTLVHSVSYINELVYDDRIKELTTDPIFSKYIDHFTYQRVITREKYANALHARITTLLANGELEKALGVTFNIENTRFMLCGNPIMVKECFEILLNKGFKLHKNKIAGQIIMEHAF